MYFIEYNYTYRLTGKTFGSIENESPTLSMCFQTVIMAVFFN